MCNYLSERSTRLQPATEEYDPTVGVRILDVERSYGGRDVMLELWDVSGDQQYERCWPAVMDKAAAVVIVYNPDDRTRESEEQLWYEYFCSKAGLPDERVMLMAHRTSSAAPGKRSRPAPAMSRVRMVHTAYDTAEDVMHEFDDFVAHVVKLDRSDRTERRK
eukprot:PLAT1547.1.p2 GENE.PLAT1547.1~~PLAT1547.1.p2  ORF type:complete len:190 (+),score=56.81 PLAT1547.1:85-570(+)